VLGTNPACPERSRGVAPSCAQDRSCWLAWRSHLSFVRVR
jgi:hypothetical protein